MRVCYHVQSHRSVEELRRLVDRISSDSPDAVVVISHQAESRGPELADLEQRPLTYVVLSRGGYGDFSHVVRYLDAMVVLREQALAVDWVINISGQDYPTRHLREVEAALTDTTADALIESWPVHSDESHWTPRNIATRYGFRHWRWRRHPAGRVRFKPLGVVNAVQPWLRLNLHYGSVGIRGRAPFEGRLVLHGGSFFANLSWKAVTEVLRFVEDEPAAVDWFEHVLAPEEIFFQTVLENAPEITVERDCRRYFDFTRSRDNSPAVLTLGDLPAVLRSDAWFARKVDGSTSIALMDELDRLAADAASAD